MCTMWSHGYETVRHPRSNTGNQPSQSSITLVVQHLVEGHEAEVVPRNAALAYLALITGFAEKGLLHVDWAPRLVIEVGEREFEVST
jgi:hypothetical protein